MNKDRKERFENLRQKKIDKIRITPEKEEKVIEALNKDLGINELLELYAKKLNSLAQENQELKDKLELKKVSKNAQENIRDEEQERLRREDEGMVGITFNGDFYIRQIPYKIIVHLKYLPDIGVSEDLAETLKRFKQHMLDFSYSRGDTQILINSIERLELEVVEEKKEESEDAKIVEDLDEGNDGGGYCG